MAILQRIENLADQLADSETKVARTILANPQQLERCTITGLAGTAGTSTSAVLRFCHSLGFAGFKDFRYELVAELQRDVSRHVWENDPLHETAEGIARAVAQLGELDRDQLDTLTAQIAQAGCVFCLGIHRSSLPASKLRMDLEDLGVLAVSASNSVHATHLANLAGDRSCTLIFSVSGNMTSFRAIVDAGMTTQGNSWLITSNPRPQLAAHVNQVVVLPSAQRAGASDVDEHPVAMAFVELLVLRLRDCLCTRTHT